MSWSARIAHTSTGLAIVFAGPVSRLDMAPDVAEHFASLIAVEARHRMTGVVRALRGDRQAADADSFSPKNMPIQVIGDAHPHFCDCSDCLNGGDHA